jgi:hypothetical protein
MGLVQSQSVVMYISLHSALPWLCLELCEIEREILIVNMILFCRN